MPDGTVFSPSYASTIKTRHQHSTSQHSTGSTGSTSGSTGSGTGTGTNGGGGSPTDPITGNGGSTDPITQATQGIGDTLTDATGTVTQPVVDTLTMAEATTLCSSQLNAITDPLNQLTSTATNRCATKVTGMTKDDALLAIPNDLLSVLAWLGL